MAVKLIECNPSNPTFNRLEASETYICNMSKPSLSIDVYLNYEGQVRCFYTHVYSYNQQDLEGN